MIAALLLGRKGSAGFPGKNTIPVLKRPLSAYPIMAAIHARLVDKVFLSTDDEKLMDIAKKYGAEIIVRPPELATKEALGEDAYVHGYQMINAKCKVKDEKLELLVLLFCNSWIKIDLFLA